MGKEPSIFYFLETEIHATGKRSALNSGERACNNINYNGSINLKRDHPLWVFPLPLGTLAHGGTFVIKRLSRGGENIEEF